MPGMTRRAGAGLASANSALRSACSRRNPARPCWTSAAARAGSRAVSPRRVCALTGLDPNAAWLDYARSRSTGSITWLEGDARRLPFPDGHFDRVVSIAALCFIDDEHTPLAEIVRVSRRRFAVGWLNRASLLYRQKAGRGAYVGARWHTAAEVRSLFDDLPVRHLTIRSAVFLPGGGRLARTVEPLLPSGLPCGALLVAAGEVVPQG